MFTIPGLKKAENYHVNLHKNRAVSTSEDRYCTKRIGRSGVVKIYWKIHFVIKLSRYTLRVGVSIIGAETMLIKMQFVEDAGLPIQNCNTHLC